MSIKVTVILPSYNVANYIEECVRSVLKQTLEEIEILCIDAGSTDGTFEKLMDLARNNTKIRVLKSEKKSYGYQMNLGIREAKGGYIGIVETDDYVDEDMFEILYNHAMKSNADAVKGVLYDVYEMADGKRKEFYGDYISDKYMTDVLLTPDETPDVHDWDGNIWNGIYKREFLINKKIWFQESPGAAFQDIAFQQMVLNEAEKVAYLHAHFYHYRKVRPGASTWNPKCIRYICDAYRGLFADGRLKENHKKYIYMRLSTAFLFELKKALCMSNYRIEDLDYPEAVEWYETEMKNAMKKGLFRFDYLREERKDEVMLFFADRSTYISAWREQAEALYAWMDVLKGKVGRSRLIVFGVGQYGHILTQFLIRNCIYVEALADNQKANNNSNYYGMRVYSADDAARVKNAFFLVANKKAGEQISNQLQTLGVSEEKMWIFDGADEALLKGLKSSYILPEKTNKG